MKSIFQDATLLGLAAALRQAAANPQSDPKLVELMLETAAELEEGETIPLRLVTD